MSYLEFWSACEGIDVWSCANSHLGAWWNHEAGDTASGELTGSDGKNCAKGKLLCLYNCLVVFNSTAQFNFFAELRQDNGTIWFYLWARWTIFCKGSRSLGQNDQACKEWLQVFSLIYPAGWQWDWGSRDSSHWRGYRFYFPVEMSETCSVEVSKQTCTFCSTQAWHKQNTSYSEQNYYISSGSLRNPAYMKLLEPLPGRTSRSATSRPLRYLAELSRFEMDLELISWKTFCVYKFCLSIFNALHDPPWSSWSSCTT